MKVFYHSSLTNTELTADGAFRTVPCKAHLELQREKSDGQYELIYNGTIIPSDTERIECNEEAELIVRQNGNQNVYSVRPLVQPLQAKYSNAYDQFFYEYKKKQEDEISSIQLGELRLYAVDESIVDADITNAYDQIEDAFSSFKAICEKPKSHLKAINEVRPIETVKRIGYESIPYLAAHSEDWLARTASGLKPARLFSRVEDDEYQIYENRVVKTLIDYILSFLRKTEKILRDRRDKLCGIINSGVQVGSFGFDVSFQKAVSELMTSDDKDDEYRFKEYDEVEKIQHRAAVLLRRYRTLRQTRLYRYLRKTKPVLNPLNETNILVMDKHYSVIFKLWKTMHRVLAAQTIEEENQIAFDDICEDYQQFCATICGYAAHVLGFELIEERHFIRREDNIALDIQSYEDGKIRVDLMDVEPRVLRVPAGVEIPIAAGTECHGFSYDGCYLSWPNDITENDIDAFCSMLKARESRGKEQADRQKRYSTLKGLLDQTQREYDAPKHSRFVIIPVAVELGTENLANFKAAMEKAAEEIQATAPNEQVVVALPVCNDNEQKATDYAREIGQTVSILPITLYDINSYRRLQNILYRQILMLGKDSCPNCGGKMRKRDNQFICDNCNQLIVTRTICPNPECRHEYTYIGYDVPESTLRKMQAVKPENYFQWDSLYQYKDIVNMSVSSGKLRAICPFCHQG